MDKDIRQLTEDSFQQLRLLHEDITQALLLLPSFGWQDNKVSEYIQDACLMLEELKKKLSDFQNIHGHYQQSMNELQRLLKESDMYDCVEDLIMVRRNLRQRMKENKQYLSKWRRRFSNN